MAAPALRAGRLQLEGKLLKPDPRKGLIRLLNDADGLTHFQWQERESANWENAEPELDVVLAYPGEAQFELIPGRRAFLLKFAEEPGRNLFFWSQEASADMDGPLAADVNGIIQRMLTYDEDMEGEGEEGSEGEAEPMDAAAAAPAAPAPAAAVASGGGRPIGADMLASVLSNIMGGAGAAAAALQQRLGSLDVGPSLGEVLKPEAVVPLLREPGMLERLAPFVPEQQRSVEALSEVLASPQFRHQLAVFSHALMSGELNLAQFGLQGTGFGVVEFLNAIQQHADTEKTERAEGKETAQ